MTAVLLIIHLIVAITLVGVVLLQRSEGGALGIGGGGGGGGMFSGRGAGNLLTRATAVLAAVFFATSIVLTIMAQRGTVPTSVFDSVEQPASGEGTAPADDGGSALPSLPPMSTEPDQPEVPVSQ